MLPQCKNSNFEISLMIRVSVKVYQVWHSDFVVVFQKITSLIFSLIRVISATITHTNEAFQWKISPTYSHNCITSLGCFKSVSKVPILYEWHIITTNADICCRWSIGLLQFFRSLKWLSSELKLIFCCDFVDFSYETILHQMNLNFVAVV